MRAAGGGTARMLPQLLVLAAALVSTAAEAPGNVATAPSPQLEAIAAADAPGLITPNFAAPAAVEQDVAAIPGASTADDAALAWSYYDKLALTSPPNGESVLLYFHSRWYGTGNLQRWPDIIAAQSQGLKETLSEIDLTFYIGAMLFQNTSGAAADALPQALQYYRGIDMFFSINVPTDEKLDVGVASTGPPILLAVSQAVRQYFLAIGLNAKGERALTLDVSYPIGFRQPAHTYFTQIMNMVVEVSAPILPSFDFVEMQTLTTNALRNAFVVGQTTVRATNITAWEDVTPAAAAPAGRRLLGSVGTGGAAAPNSAARVTLALLLLPIDAFTPMQLFEAALGGGKFENMSALVGLEMGVKFISVSTVTKRVPVSGPIETRIKNGTNNLSGFDPTEEVDLTTTASAPAQNSSQTAAAPGTAVTSADRSDGGLSGGKIAGIVIAALVAAALLALAVWAFTVRRRHSRGWSSADSDRAPLDKDIPSSGPSYSEQHAAGRQAHTGSSGTVNYSISTNGAAMAGSVPAATVVGLPVAAEQRHVSHQDGLARQPQQTAPVRTSPTAERHVRGAGGDHIDLLTQPEIAVNEITFCTKKDGRRHTLGKGSFGTVYKGLRWGVQEVAVKVLFQDPSVHSDSWLRLLKREVGMMQRVSFDRNIVQFYGACLENCQDAMLVMEYLKGGDLRKALNRDSSGEFRWYRRGAGIALDVVRGLSFLHASGVVHRDLKSSNVLLTGDGIAKISDHGMAKLAEADESSLRVAGTFAYAAPELLLDLKCTDKADMYSFGVVLWEIITGERPYRGQLRGLQVPEDCPQELEDLMGALLAVDPQQRPSAQQVYQRLSGILPAPSATDTAVSSATAAASHQR